MEAKWDAAEFREAIDHSVQAMSSVGAPTTWVLSNHDVIRHATRYADGDEATGRRRARAAALVQLGLPGVAYLYYGDELALPNVELPDEVLQDPVWERSGHTERGRDGERVPMPWGGEKPPYDFTTGPTTWLPMPDGWAELTVETPAGGPGARPSRSTAARSSCVGTTRRCPASRSSGSARRPAAWRSAGREACSARSTPPTRPCRCHRARCCWPAGRWTRPTRCRRTPPSGSPEPTPTDADARSALLGSLSAG